MKIACTVLLLAGLLAAAAPAFARSGACYSPAELEAEEYLRLHAELMVVSLTCHTDSQGSDLMQAYTSFGNTNGAALSAAEKTMQQFYRVNHVAGIHNSDDLHTRLGNEFGQQMADVSAPVFCGQLRDLPVTMASSGEQRIKEQIVSMETSSKSYAPRCAP